MINLASADLAFCVKNLTAICVAYLVAVACGKPSVIYAFYKICVKFSISFTNILVFLELCLVAKSIVGMEFTVSPEMFASRADFMESILERPDIMFCAFPENLF